MATIYKITNKLNNSCYIGKTVRPVKFRWQQHKRSYQYCKQQNITTIPLYNAFNAYGIDNFIFEIVEDNIPNEDINNKEKYYIQFFHSKVKDGGYNVTGGGDGGRSWSKLSDKDVKEIIEILQDENNLQHFDQIGKKYNISKDVIGAINRGECWFQENIEYPIRKYDTTGLTISKQKYQNIINDILYSNMLLKDIQKKYKISEEQMTNINNGKFCYNNQHPYYKGIYNGAFPIRKNNFSQIITNEQYFIPIFYDVLFSSASMEKIGNKYNILGNTLYCITTGKRRKELTKNFILPMRKNLQINQQIFLSLYPQFKGGDAKCATLD